MFYITNNGGFVLPRGGGGGADKFLKTFRETL